MPKDTVFFPLPFQKIQMDIHWYSWDKTFDNLLYFRGNQIKLLLVFFYYSWRVASDKEFFHYFNVTILETYGFVI